MTKVDAVHVASALSLMEGRSRREWKVVMETLRLLGVSWADLLAMTSSQAWKWLGWDAGEFRKWNTALAVADVHAGRSVDAGISVVSDLDDDAPGWLRRLQTVPWVFYQGDPSILDRTTIGFSGQRDARHESLEITTALAREAARLDYCVVSGGARGIDMAAHTTAVREGGVTAVLLPHGLLTWNVPYKLANPNVADRVLAISEDVPWEVWNTEGAMRRNRMIVDVARIFTVPQSGTRGGSHGTALYALRKERVTFVPDLGEDFPGNLELLQRGARPIELIDGQPDLKRMLAESAPAEPPSQVSLF